jgi:hypothetical protein
MMGPEGEKRGQTVGSIRSCKPTNIPTHNSGAPGRGTQSRGSGCALSAGSRERQARRSKSRSEGDRKESILVILSFHILPG